MSELQKLPEGKAKLTDFQKKYNISSKNLIHIIGTNISLFVCILLPILLVGFIWTDFGVPEINVKYVTDGITTVMMLVIGEIMMMRIGSDGGKLDSEYISVRKNFLDLVENVTAIGTDFMSAFCELQINTEMEQALTARLRALRLTEADWEVIKGMDYDALKKKYGKHRAKKLLALNELEPIQLNEAILLYESENEAFPRGGVPISGEGYMKKKMYSVDTLISCIFAGLLTVSVAITLTTDISFARVMYTFLKLVVLFYRMAIGYDIGARAFNTVEVRQLKAKCHYLRLYEKFVADKTTTEDYQSLPTTTEEE